MLVFKFPIMIFIFTYFISNIRHKLTVMYVTKLDAVIADAKKLLPSVVIAKKYQPP